MNQSVTIFDATSSPKSGVFVLRREKPVRPWKKRLAKSLIALSLLTTILFFSPFLWAESRYRFHFLKNKVASLAGQESNQLEEEVIVSKFRLLISPRTDELEIVIPKIGVKIRTVLNIDAAQPEKYQSLLIDKAAHARGSSLPGEDNLIFIFGHSSAPLFNLQSFNPVFYLLKELEAGDQIILIHQGSLFFYQTEEKKVVDPKDLTDVLDNQGQEKLILQTCWPPGTRWKRLLIIASPINET